MNVKKIYYLLFSPNSHIELFLRTLFHKINNSKFLTYIRSKLAGKSYWEWVNQQNIYLANQNSSNCSAIITFLLPIPSNLYNPSLLTIKSLIEQRSENWRLVLFPGVGATLPKELLNEVSDERIQIVESTSFSIESVYSKSNTDYFIICEAGDKFSPSFLEILQKAVNGSPRAELISFDVEINMGNIKIPLFKPLRYSPELHLSTNYLSRSVISASTAKRYIDKLDINIGLLAQEWELLLSMCDQELRIKHIPHVLMQLSSENKVTNDEHIKLIQNHFKRKFNFQCEVLIKQEITKVKWNSAQPLVSLIIPTKNNRQKLMSLMSSLFERTKYPLYEIIIVDTGSTDDRLLGTYESLIQKHPVKVLNYQGNFNYSKANNLGACNAKGDLLLFLNDDMQVLNEDWLSELVQWALIDKIGVVGTKLKRPNNTLQHIGIVVGMQNLVGHLYLNAPVDYYGLMGSANWYRNVSALTGACQMMRRSLFEELGGYDENYELVFSDITLCLKALKLGYRNLYTPHAALLHHEGASRGYKTPVEDILRGYEEMDEILRNGDPYFSPNLTLEPIPRCEMDSWKPGHRSQKYLKRKNYYLAHRSKPDKVK